MSMSFHHFDSSLIYKCVESGMIEEARDVLRLDEWNDDSAGLGDMSLWIEWENSRKVRFSCHKAYL